MPIIDALLNVKKPVFESLIGGTKGRFYWTLAENIKFAPKLVPIIDRDDIIQSKILVGNFIFQNENMKFNFFDFDTNTGNLEWKIDKNIFQLDFDFQVSTYNSSLLFFVEAFKNANLIVILERSDCSGEKFLFGGPCQPAKITDINGTLGLSAQNYGGTNFHFLAFSDGMPPMLPLGLQIPVYGDDDVVLLPYLLQENGAEILQENGQPLLI